jgi:hypothetical protein
MSDFCHHCMAGLSKTNGLKSCIEHNITMLHKTFDQAPDSACYSKILLLAKALGINIMGLDSPIAFAEQVRTAWSALAKAKNVCH